MIRIIAYAHDADLHCVECTRADADVGMLKREPPLQIGVDERGLALDLVDGAGNPVTPVFDISGDADGYNCGTCGEDLS